MILNTFYEVEEVIWSLKQTKEAMDAISSYKHAAPVEDHLCSCFEKKKPSESHTSIHELNELLQMRNRQ